MRRLIKWPKRLQASVAPNGGLDENAILDERSIFRPSREHVRGHSAIFGNLGMGKTTLIGQLANAAIQNGDAVIVIDMDGDLTPALLGQVPPKRAKDVCWIKTDDSKHVPGFNVLDVSHGEPSKLIVDNLVYTAPELWGNYWKPDVEEALRIAVRTLIAANRALVQRTEPQFTFRDLKRLFELPNFCRQVLDNYVTDREVSNWWKSYVDRPSSLNRYDFAALLVPFERITAHYLLPILGQSDSSFDLRQRLEPGCITLFDLSGIAWNTELHSWFGALLADRINRTIRAREHVVSANRGAHIVVAVNGDLSIPGIDESGFLADLQERCADYIFSNCYSQAVIENAVNLFVFRTLGCEADDLMDELGGKVSTHDILSLFDYQFYFRTYARSGNIVIKRYATPAPVEGDANTMSRIPDHLTPCGQKERDVRHARERFEHRWYECEMQALINHAELSRRGDDA